MFRLSNSENYKFYFRGYNSKSYYTTTWICLKNQCCLLAHFILLHLFMIFHQVISKSSLHKCNAAACNLSGKLSVFPLAMAQNNEFPAFL